MFSFVSKSVSKINDFFILIILVLFYFVVVGITALFFWVFTRAKNKKGKTSYWQERADKKFDRDYFTLPY